MFVQRTTLGLSVQFIVWPPTNAMNMDLVIPLVRVCAVATSLLLIVASAIPTTMVKTAQHSAMHQRPAMEMVAALRKEFVLAQQVMQGLIAWLVMRTIMAPTVHIVLHPQRVITMEHVPLQLVSVIALINSLVLIVCNAPLSITVPAVLHIVPIREHAVTMAIVTLQQASAFVILPMQGQTAVSAHKIIMVHSVSNIVMLLPAVRTDHVEQMEFVCALATSRVHIVICAHPNTTALFVRHSAAHQLHAVVTEFATTRLEFVSVSLNTMEPTVVSVLPIFMVPLAPCTVLPLTPAMAMERAHSLVLAIARSNLLAVTVTNARITITDPSALNIVLLLTRAMETDIATTLVRASAQAIIQGRLAIVAQITSLAPHAKHIAWTLCAMVMEHVTATEFASVLEISLALIATPVHHNTTALFAILSVMPIKLVRRMEIALQTEAATAKQTSKPLIAPLAHRTSTDLSAILIAQCRIVATTELATARQGRVYANLTTRVSSVLTALMTTMDLHVNIATQR
jgi:hypothetical protein